MSTERTTHVIVGGGISGLILTRKLLDAGNDVILIERGSDEEHSSRQQDPIQWPAAAFDEYSTLTIPQKILGNRQIRYCQGNGIGGGSRINAMILTGGHAAVYDNYWPKSWNTVEMTR